MAIRITKKQREEIIWKQLSDPQFSLFDFAKLPITELIEWKKLGKKVLKTYLEVSTAKD